MIEGTFASGSLLAGSSASTDRTTLGRDEFMKLLLTQLSHQDPLNPMEPHEFASQLANFSSVEQLSQISDDLALQSESIQMDTILSKTTFSAALLGRLVLAEGSQVVIPEEGAAEIHVDVGEGGGTATLKLLDSSGVEVESRDLGPVASGRQTLTLPDDLAAGTYTYEIVVTDAQDNTVPVTTYTSGIVDRVLFEEGGIVLRIGEMEFALESLVEIAPAPAEQ